MPLYVSNWLKEFSVLRTIYISNIEERRLKLYEILLLFLLNIKIVNFKNNRKIQITVMICVSLLTNLIRITGLKNLRRDLKMETVLLFYFQ